MDLNNMLCLACSSSILANSRAPVHVTNCCLQAICYSCIQANPRLATYDPCLACLSGVGASRGKPKIYNPSTKPTRPDEPNPHPANVNDNETVFVLGDDSDEDPEEQETPVQEDNGESQCSPLSEPPGYQEAVNPSITEQPSALLPPHPDFTPTTLDPSAISEESSRKYYIEPRDSIHGIALRFGVDARELSRRNNLPFSTLNTTPHLLHTRTFLELPPSSEPLPLQYVLSKEDRAKRDAQRARERAEKKLQMVTKEVDCQVAKTYIALAGNVGIGDEVIRKRKEASETKDTQPITDSSDDGLESRAIDMYLDDEEWEQNELGAGRSPCVPQFPLSPRPATKSLAFSTKARRWPWKS